MPVIINSEETHPFLPSIGSPSAIERSRAEAQDIRPLNIAILNLMADKQATERQLAFWLGNTTLQIKLTFVATDDYVRGVRAGRETKNTPADHIRKFYSAWSDVKGEKFDGLIVSGVNALKQRVADEDIWPEVQKILAWSETNVLSSLFLCWGAKAALKHFHDIESYKGEKKISGVFDFRILSDKSKLLTGFPDVFPVPVSRWKSPRREDIRKRAGLEIVAESAETGADMLVESASYDKGRGLYQRRVYILNHPEYETDALKSEYERDNGIDPATAVPLNYFSGNDPSQAPLNKWRHTAHVYTNWIKAIYEATPADVKDVPRPFNP